MNKKRGKSPQFGVECWLADNAAVVGEVILGNNCTVWFGAVVRGDVNSIVVGNNTNIQDNATIHCTYEKSSTSIGSNVSIGHNAMVHGCTIKDNVLIGMGAIVMDDVIIESNSIIAAGAIVTKGTHVESGCVYAGIPAKKIKEVGSDLLEGEINRIAESYLMYSSWYMDEK